MAGVQQLDELGSVSHGRCGIRCLSGGAKPYRTPGVKIGIYIRITIPYTYVVWHLEHCVALEAFAN